VGARAGSAARARLVLASGRPARLRGHATTGRHAHRWRRFESEYVWLGLVRGSQITRGEFFEIDGLDAALACFEELRPDPLRIPPNAAARVRDRQARAFLARDWDAMRALAGADFVYEDRGKRALVRGDVETWIASMQFVAQPGFRIESSRSGRSESG